MRSCTIKPTLIITPAFSIHLQPHIYRWQRVVHFLHTSSVRVSCVRFENGHGSIIILMHRFHRKYCCDFHSKWKYKHYLTVEYWNRNGLPNVNVFHLLTLIVNTICNLLGIIDKPFQFQFNALFYYYFPSFHLKKKKNQTNSKIWIQIETNQLFWMAYNLVHLYYTLNGEVNMETLSTKSYYQLFYGRNLYGIAS